jgi:two-component system, sensor histidine kinase and response regulator
MSDAGKSDPNAHDVSTHNAPHAWKAPLAQRRHDLRTPLNAVIGYSEILLEELADSGADDGDLAPIELLRSDGRALLELVGSALDAARLERLIGENGDAAREVENANIALAADARPIAQRAAGRCEQLLRESSLPGNFLAACADDLAKIHAAACRFLELLDAPQSPHAEAAPSSAPPIEYSNAGAARPLLHEDAPENAAAPALTGRILVVDDTELNCDLLAQRLHRQGHSVDVAGNGRLALEKLAVEAFDVVLLDIMMPEMDGLQVLQFMKNDPQLRHIPVIMISALDELDSVIRCIEMGAEDYLHKPFRPVLLRARIDACLEKKQLRDQERALFAQLQENFARLQELESLRDSLTHMVVHDLRTPLTSLIAGLQSMEAFGELNESQRECLHISESGGQTLLRMINDLLDISKMEAGELQLERSEIQAAELTGEVLLQVKNLVAEREQHLEVAVAPGVAAFCGDREKLIRVLVNLVGNAGKFTPSGGKITVAARMENDAVLFSVSDTGEGIPEEAFERIFEKFGQVAGRKSGRRMSTGLGLTFCKMVVEAHGGRIWVESEVGKGSTFSFSIPR